MTLYLALALVLPHLHRHLGQFLHLLLPFWSRRGGLLGLKQEIGKESV